MLFKDQSGEERRELQCDGMVRDGPSEGEGWSRDPRSKAREADFYLTILPPIAMYSMGGGGSKTGHWVSDSRSWAAVS